jgi:glycosyltransferase involved in cell wall biosynthesis
MLRFLQQSNACFQALSSRSVSSLISHGFRPQHIVHISGSVDTGRFHPAPEQHSNAVNPQRIILCVARLEYSKGIDVLLHAWGRLQRTIAQQPQPTLWVVGDGILKAQLERIAAELHVADSIKFLGTRKDVLALLQKAEVFVLPSRWEGMPNALLEAMACGLPCVATRVSGSEDIITDGINGLLVPPAQPAALAHALQRLIEETDFAQQMGEAARATAVRDYQLSNIVNQCLALYKQLINQQHQKGKAHGQSTYIHRYPNISSPGRRSGETGPDARP